MTSCGGEWKPERSPQIKVTTPESAFPQEAAAGWICHQISKSLELGWVSKWHLHSSWLQSVSTCDGCDLLKGLGGWLPRYRPPLNVGDRKGEANQACGCDNETQWGRGVILESPAETCLLMSTQQLLHLLPSFPWSWPWDSCTVAGFTGMHHLVSMATGTSKSEKGQRLQYPFVYGPFPPPPSELGHCTAGLDKMKQSIVEWSSVSSPLWAIYQYSSTYRLYEESSVARTTHQLYTLWRKKKSLLVLKPWARLLEYWAKLDGDLYKI